MDKYTILIILNLPFVLFGITHAFLRYKEGLSGRFSFWIRLAFWLFVSAGLVGAKYLYNLLVGNNLTDSTPLSLADVILFTGLSVCLFLTIRAYTKLDHTEKRLSELQERLSVILSER